MIFRFQIIRKLLVIYQNTFFKYLVFIFNTFSVLQFNWFLLMISKAKSRFCKMIIRIVVFQCYQKWSIFVRYNDHEGGGGSKKITSLMRRGLAKVTERGGVNTPNFKWRHLWKLITINMCPFFSFRLGARANTDKCNIKITGIVYWLWILLPLHGISEIRFSGYLYKIILFLSIIFITIFIITFIFMKLKGGK